jgi:sugar O-acyltransferase (sialic acid O-acetyltransferase NeuD family)
MIEIIIVGAFYEIIELAQNCGYKIYALVDKHKTGKYKGYPILGDDYSFKLHNIKYPVVISPDIPETRMKLFDHYFDRGFNFTSLISSNAKISQSAKIGKGSIIQSFVNISCDSTLGEFVKCNTFANIMHDVKIGDFTTIAPNAVILGNVKIGRGCYIGANATILPNISISDNVIVGAGSVVTKNIESNKTVYGVPAK